jgi:outer membrane protein assembly factor BamB
MFSSLFVGFGCSGRTTVKHEKPKLPKFSGLNTPKLLNNYSFSTDQAHQGVYKGLIGKDLHLLWSTKVGILGYHNHPLVVKKWVIVSSYGQKWNKCDVGDGVYFLHRSSGQISHFIPTRCDANGISTDGKTLYAVTDAGELFAWDLNTRILRYRTVPHGGLPNTNKLYAPPLILKAGLFVSGGKGFAALVNPITGKILQRFKARGTIRNHSALGNQIVFGGGNNTTWIYNINGKLSGTWKNSGDEGSVYGAPALTPQHIAVAGPFDGSGAQDAWALLNAKTTRPRWNANPLVGSKASPIINGNKVYFASSGELDEGSSFSEGSLEAFDITSGKSLWELKKTFGSWSSPIVTGNKIVWMGTNGTLMIINNKTGKVLGSLELNTNVFATPAIADGIIYIGGEDGKMQAIDTKLKINP